MIGMIGGVSWESTFLYYKLINESVREQLGNLNSAKILLYSLNYEPIVELERDGKWNEVGDEIASSAKTLQDGGKILPVSKDELIQMIQGLQKAGAEAILLGCTELGMIVKENDATIPIYDTTVLHVKEVVKMYLNQGI